MRALVAWRGGLFLTEGKIGVLSVSSLFLTRVEVYVGVCVCIRTHTHTHCTDGVLGCEPRSRDETPGGPEESGWTKSRYTYIRICVQSTHVYIYAQRRDEILDELLFSFNMSFFFEKSRRCDDNQQTTVTHFGENRRLRLESSIQNYYIVSF
jgi:hypothetical protein